MEEKILIIEDSKEIIELLVDILISNNFIVDYISDGSEAIEKIKKENYQLVILDLQLPEKDGFEVLEEIKKINENLPVIILTGFGTTENIVKAIKMGAVDFIEKPFDIQNLIEKVRKYIKISSLEKELTKFKLIESILQLNRTIISLSDIETLLNTIIQILNNLFSPDRIGIYLFNSENKNYILKKYKFKNFEQKIKLVYTDYEIQELFGSKNILIQKSKNDVNLKILVK